MKSTIITFLIGAALFWIGYHDASVEQGSAMPMFWLPELIGAGLMLVSGISIIAIMLSKK